MPIMGCSRASMKLCHCFPSLTLSVAQRISLHFLLFPCIILCAFISRVHIVNHAPPRPRLAALSVINPARCTSLVDLVSTDAHFGIDSATLAVGPSAHRLHAGNLGVLSTIGPGAGLPCRRLSAHGPLWTANPEVSRVIGLPRTTLQQ